jgi:hypothetical protein
VVSLSEEYLKICIDPDGDLIVLFGISCKNLECGMAGFGRWLPDSMVEGAAR